jgi:hypothetical protein
MKKSKKKVALKISKKGSVVNSKGCPHYTENDCGIQYRN